LNKATFSMVSRLSLFAKCRVVSPPVKITVSVLSVIVASAYAEKRGADERTRTADLISLRVIIQALQRFARACKTRISKPVSFLSFARCCTVLRSRWYQIGIINTLSSTFDEGILSLGQSLLKRHPHIYPGCRSLASNRRAYYLRAYPCFPHSRG
jgi:hypothetical protein